MSRSRNIKPGFFKNEDLADLTFSDRLLFIGLWTLADREGRMEDRPKRIKAEVFPYDSVDVEAGLSALESRGFITRYKVKESHYIQVVNFLKHQSPHVKEAASSIPAPDEHGASMVQAPEIPERARLIPDSLNLIPDSKVGEKASTPINAKGTEAGRACKLMRQAGCSATNPSHPELLAALTEGVTPEALADTAREAVEAGKSKPFAWAITTARSRHAEGASHVRTQTGRKLSAVEQVQHAIESRQSGRVIEGEVVPHPSGPSVAAHGRALRHNVD